MSWKWPDGPKHISQEHPEETDVQSRRASLIIFLSAFAAASLIASPGATAKDDLLHKGIQEYHARDYRNAAGHLGAALTTDFNNPVLHYYLANSYVNLNETKGAIREFRIAYALDPEGEVGKFSKQALAYLGAELTEVAAKKEPPPVQKPVPKVDPHLERALNTLDRQGDLAHRARIGEAKSVSDELSRKGDEALRTKRSDMMSRLPSWYKRLKDNQLPDDMARQLEILRREFDSRKSNSMDTGMREASELKRSAENLRGLLNEKPKSGATHLDPVGTNLYTRNYKHSAAGNKAAPGAAGSAGAAKTRSGP